MVSGFLVRYFLTASSVKPSFSAAVMTDEGGDWLEPWAPSGESGRKRKEKKRTNDGQTNAACVQI